MSFDNEMFCLVGSISMIVNSMITIDLCSDLEKVQKEIVQVLKRKKKGNERSNNKDWLRSVFKNIN